MPVERRQDPYSVSGVRGSMRLPLLALGLILGLLVLLFGLVAWPSSPRFFQGRVVADGRGAGGARAHPGHGGLHLQRRRRSLSSSLALRRTPAHGLAGRELYRRGQGGAVSASDQAAAAPGCGPRRLRVGRSGPRPDAPSELRQLSRRDIPGMARTAPMPGPSRARTSAISTTAPTSTAGPASAGDCLPSTISAPRSASRAMPRRCRMLLRAP